MKKLKSVLVRQGDKNLQIIQRLAEAIQDAGGEADDDLLRLLSEERLADEVAKLMVRSLFVRVATIEVAPKGANQLLDLVNTVPVGDEIGDIGKRDSVLKALPVQYSCAGHYTLFRVARGSKLSVFRQVMARYGLNMADPSQLILCLPEIREYIKENYKSGYYLRFYAASHNNLDTGVFFQSQTAHGQDWLSEILRTWNTGTAVSSASSDLILVQGAV